jgi:hypothetical protein
VDLAGISPLFWNAVLVMVRPAAERLAAAAHAAAVANSRSFIREA